MGVLLRLTSRIGRCRSRTTLRLSRRSLISRAAFGAAAALLRLTGRRRLGCIVGRVKSGSLELHGGSGNQALHFALANGAFLCIRGRKGLNAFEAVPTFFTLVFVERHPCAPLAIVGQFDETNFSDGFGALQRAQDRSRDTAIDLDHRQSIVMSGAKISSQGKVGYVHLMLA